MAVHPLSMNVPHFQRGGMNHGLIAVLRRRTVKVIAENMVKMLQIGEAAIHADALDWFSG